MATKTKMNSTDIIITTLVMTAISTHSIVIVVAVISLLETITPELEFNMVIESTLANSI